MSTPHSHLKNKVILITGGTGSFGRAMVRTLLKQHEPSKVIVFSRDELKQWEMRESDPVFSHPNIRYFLGDVRDRDRLSRAFLGVDIVVHAAALKQVPAAEYNPGEFVKTNVLGAMNIIDAAVDRGVRQVLALSTDKAVAPANLYGATKLCSDRLFIAGNVYVGAEQSTRFGVVRYGNVLGSRGSVLPLWKALLEKRVKELPLTDERMTRFIITLPQAVDFVLRSLPGMEGGEVFVPKLPSARMVDLARALDPDVGFHVTGIRPGEKLHEWLLAAEDVAHTFEDANGYVVATRPPNATPRQRVAPSFEYRSDLNTWYLTADQLRGMVA